MGAAALLAGAAGAMLWSRMAPYLSQLGQTQTAQNRPKLPEIVNEQIGTVAERAARRRRGMGSTLLTSDLGVNPANIGKNRLLGA
jgi:hypothetical protein